MANGRWALECTDIRVRPTVHTGYMQLSNVSDGSRDPDCPVCITFKLNHHKSLPVPEAAWIEDSGWDHANYCPQGGGSRN